MTGRILQRGDTLVVAAELIDVTRQSQLWGERFTRRLDDIFAIEEELAAKISESLRGTLTRDDKQRLAQRSTDDSEAYRLYLRGRHAFFRRTPDSLERGLRYFEQAIERDPNYALAYSGLSDSYGVLSFFGGSRPRDVFLKCREAATRAVAIDDGLAEGHVSLGLVRAAADWNWREAEREFRRAIEINPQYFQAHTWLAFQVLGPLGRFDEAAAEVQAGLEMECPPQRTCMAPWSRSRVVGPTTPLDTLVRRWSSFAHRGGGNLDRETVIRYLQREVRNKRAAATSTRSGLGWSMRALAKLNSRWTVWNGQPATSRSTAS